jgi:DNA primase
MIEDLLDEIGVEDIQPKDNEVGARCPQHEQRTGEREHHPRHWFINRSTGQHHCFSCGYKGSLIRLVMDMTRQGLWDAYRLIHHFDVELDGPQAEVDWQPPVLDIAVQLARFGEPPQRAVLRRRLCLNSIDKFGVRWDYDDPAWIFPIFGPGGELWGWQAKGADMVRNFPPGIRKSRTLFGLPVLSSDVYVVLVESPLDAVYLDTLGYPALASFGAGVSDAQMRLIIEHVDELVLALDNDSAGREETRRLLHGRWHHRLPMSIFNYKGTAAKDPGECLSNEVDAGIRDAILAAFWS